MNEVKFGEYDKWLKRIGKGCKNMKEPPYMAIPCPLPQCELTHDVCRIDVCPKVKKETKQ
jgi:hypothetical protein